MNDELSFRFVWSRFYVKDGKITLHDQPENHLIDDTEESSRSGGLKKAPW